MTAKEAKRHREVLPGERPVPPVERAGTVVTQLIRFGGLVVALNEVLIAKSGSTHALLLGAFMMAGAQGLDSFLTAFFGGKK